MKINKRLDRNDFYNRASVFHNKHIKKSYKKDKAVGYVHRTNYCGYCKIVEYIDYNNVTVQFISTKSVVYKLNMGSIRHGEIKDPASLRYKNGDKIITNFNGNATVTNYIDDKHIGVTFDETGFYTIVRSGNIMSGKIKDHRLPSVAKIGYIGDCYVEIKKRYPKELVSKIHTMWNSMIRRCYNENFENYRYYGGSGVTVAVEWHNFSKFFYDFLELPGYDEQGVISSKLQLDKDKLQLTVPQYLKVYSKHTCSLLSPNENHKIQRHNIKITRPISKV